MQKKKNKNFAYFVKFMSRHDKNIICEDEDADIRESRRERDYGKIKTDLGILYNHT